jgi:hypothetical protein
VNPPVGFCAVIIVRYSSDAWRKAIWTGAKKIIPAGSISTIALEKLIPCVSLLGHQIFVWRRSLRF